MMPERHVWACAALLAAGDVGTRAFAQNSPVKSFAGDTS